MYAAKYWTLPYVLKGRLFYLIQSVKAQRACAADKKGKEIFSIMFIRYYVLETISSPE